PVVEKSGQWSNRAFDLRIRALTDADLPDEAIEALEERAMIATGGDAKRESLIKAFELASRSGDDSKAHAIAETLAKASPDDADTQVRLARASTEDNDAAAADAAWKR